MSQTSDLIAKIGEDLAGVSTNVGVLGREISDLKAQVAAGQDPADTIAALTDLETKAAAVKAATDALLPPPATEPAV